MVTVLRVKLQSWWSLPRSSLGPPKSPFWEGAFRSSPASSRNSPAPSAEEIWSLPDIAVQQSTTFQASQTLGTSWNPAWGGGSQRTNYWNCEMVSSANDRWLSLGPVTIPSHPLLRHLFDNFWGKPITAVSLANSGCEALRIRFCRQRSCDSYGSSGSETLLGICDVARILTPTFAILG